MKVRNSGYKPAPLQPDHWMLGSAIAAPQIVIMKDGHGWQNIPHTFEPQRRSFETFDCTAFGTLHCIELLSFLQQFTENYSERFMGIVAGTSQNGNDPHTVAEALRNSGAIAEGVLPFNDSIENIKEFYSFKGNDEQTCRDAGLNWTYAWEFAHEWVFNGAVDNKPDLIKQALQFSPLGVSVQAWILDPKTGYFTKPKGGQDWHWTTLVDYVEGQYWIIDDSYLYDEQGNIVGVGGSSIKKLAWDYDFGCAKRYHLKLNKTWHKSTWYGTLFDRILKLLGLK